MLDADSFFSQGVSLAGPSVILNSDTAFITIALMAFSSVCFSFVSCISGSSRGLGIELDNPSFNQEMLFLSFSKCSAVLTFIFSSSVSDICVFPREEA